MDVTTCAKNGLITGLDNRLHVHFQVVNIKYYFIKCIYVPLPQPPPQPTMSGVPTPFCFPEVIIRVPVAIRSYDWIVIKDFSS